MKSKLITACTSMAIIFSASAEEVSVPAQPDQEQERVQQPVVSAQEIQRPDIAAPVAVRDTAAAPTQRNVTLDDLKQNPQLAEQMLNQMLVQQNWAGVDAVLQIYRTSPNPDPILVKYAEGALLRIQRQHKKAIDIYRSLIAENPTLTRVRLDLAIMLFEDKQYVAARDQFERVRASKDAKPDIALIDAYLERIQKQEGWDLGGGLSYLHDDNINNASASKTIRVGDTILNKKPDSLPQKATGIRYNANAERDFNITGSHYFNIEGNIHGRKAIKKHEFDDTILRLYAGYHYQDANLDIKVRPTFATRYNGGKHYTNTVGLTADTSYWLNPQLRLSGSTVLEHEKVFGSNEKYSKNYYSLTGGALYAPSSTRYFYGGLTTSHERVIHSPVSSYIGLGGYAGWGQDWPYGISTRLSGNLTHKRYLGENNLLAGGHKRKDNVYGLDLTIWNRDWHLWGITPKLNLSTNVVDSNISDLYSYEKGNISLKFDKTF